MRVTYLTYDGLLDPLGQSQVIPYLERLAQRHGYRFEIISFEKSDRWLDARARIGTWERVTEFASTWVPLRYHKRLSGPATLYDLARGTLVGQQRALRTSPDLIHVRSYPAMVIGQSLRVTHRVPLIFDIRGLYPEERVDGDLWSATGHLYRSAKRLERRFFGAADAVVTLTQASVPEVSARMAAARSRATLDVIPTAVDLVRFVPSVGTRDRPVLAYFGSIGTWYDVDAMMQFARVASFRWPEAIVRFVVNNGGDIVEAAARRAGVIVDVRSVGHSEVPAALEDATATFHFIRPAPSKVASSATKFGESLALGLPVVLNDGVGDAAELVRKHGVGVVVRDFSDSGYAAALDEMQALVALPGIRERCRRLATEEFSLETAVGRYEQIYERLRGGTR